MILRAPWTWTVLQAAASGGKHKLELNMAAVDYISSDAEKTMTDIYEIRVEGHLDDGWSDHFEGLALTREEDGTTVLTGPVEDQAALHGILKKIRNLAVTLISVKRIESSEDEHVAVLHCDAPNEAERLAE